MISGGSSPCSNSDPAQELVATLQMPPATNSATHHNETHDIMRAPTITRMRPAVQQYPWGKKGEESAVARLLPTFSPDSPYAELWVGSHPSASSRVVDRADQSLRELIAEDPRSYLGDSVSSRFGELPFLLKILSVGEPLSIQAHPDRARAQQLHRTSPQHYPDPNHKPEMGVALTTTHLLFGLKERSLLIDTFARYPVLLNLVPRDCVIELKGTSQVIADAELRKMLYQALLTAPATERIAAVREVCSMLLEHPPCSLFEELIPQLVETYGPEDIGILSGLLLNEVILAPGQAIFIAPNIPHAYLSGDIIECMAASDNVVRAGLTKKFQDIETLLEMVDYDATTGGIIEPLVIPGPTKIRRYKTPTAEFSLSVIEDANMQLTFETDSKPEILFLLQGSAVITTTNEAPASLTAGDAAFVPAPCHHYQIDPTDCSFVRVSIPDPH